MFEVAQGIYTILVEDGSVPALLGDYAKHAAIYEEVDHHKTTSGNTCFVAIRKDNGWPFLVLTLQYSPSGGGFNPGILLVPETDTLFVGAGEHLLAFDVATPRRLWQDKADTGFW